MNKRQRRMLRIQEQVLRGRQERHELIEREGPRKITVDRGMRSYEGVSFMEAVLVGLMRKLAFKRRKPGVRPHVPGDD